MPAIQAARPAATRPWRERLWEQDDWAWLLALLVALLAIRLMVLVLARTDLLFDEAQYWTWSRDLDFGYFTKPPLIASITRLATDVCGNAEWCVRAFGLHLGAALVITLGPIFAPEITKITGPDWNPYARVLGRRGLAATTRRLAEQQGATSVLTDNREVTGELVYYLRDMSLPVLIWWRGEPPRNQFEITHPFTASAPEPLLSVTLVTGKTSVPKHRQKA